MNYKMIFYTIGRMVKLFGLTLLIPMIVAIGYGEDFLSFIWTILIIESIGFIFTFRKPKDLEIYSKEAIVSIALAWIIISLLGALLYIISGAIPYFFDAFFEMISGITTTGATILVDIESLPRGILFYRSFTNFLGGIGILIFILAISSNGNINAIFFLRAESTGPSRNKMTNKVKNTAIATYIIYFGITILCFISLLLTGLDWFDACTLSFSTAGTGGLAPKNQSVASYGNLGAEIVITIFMFIFSINFAVYFLIFTGKILLAIKNEELWTFVIIFFASIILVTIDIIDVVGGFWNALRYASFEVSSSISCCGFGNTDYNNWPTFSKSLLLLIMVMGGCAGSTAGGLKVSRVVGLVKSSKQKLLQVTNPRKVLNVKIDGKVQDESFINSLYFYFCIYVTILAISTLLLSMDPAVDVQTALSACIATFNNAGPGIGIVGPLGNYGSLASGSKFLLSYLMLLGRLEIFPMIIIFIPSTWRKRKRSKQKNSYDLL